MRSIKRRDFLTGLSGTVAALALPSGRVYPGPNARSLNGGCWLSVCVPLVVEDPANGIQTNLTLTSATFSGIEGYADREASTDYEIELYDPAGNRVNKTMRLSIPAMRATQVKCGDLVGGRDGFWGGMRIRMWAKGKQPTFVADLFSAAFASWNLRDSFDALHAHPDPLQLQTPEKFFSSMPFPSLEEYSCTLSLFNPYEQASEGRILVYSPDGAARIEQAYRLAPRGATLFNLNAGTLSTDFKEIFARATAPRKEICRGGSIIIENTESSAKNYAYMMIKGKTGNCLAAEHTIHQGNYQVKAGSSPFGPDRSFLARGWLYSAFVFNDKTLGKLNMSSRVYLSSGRPLEDEMWLLAYALDAEGNIHWSASKDDELSFLLPSGFLSQGAIRLRPFQSCELDFEKLSMKSGFAGGIGVTSSLQTSHVLMKIEVRVNNWGTSAFSHFRPGARAARALQKIKDREGLVSDYIVSGVRLKQTNGVAEADSLIGLVNMEQEKIGDPTVEVFNGDGFVTKKRLGPLPGLACKHILVSDLFPDLMGRGAGPLTLRLVDSNAAVTLSALHIDYKRRDVAIDHGSDRFSTYEFGCQ